MKRPNITPGDWTATATPSSEFAHRAIINQEEGYRVATVGAPKDCLPHIKEQTANAQAIAAVPTLLEALERLWYVASLKLDQSATHEGLTNCKTLAEARQALIKAGYEFDFAKQPD